MADESSTQDHTDAPSWLFSFGASDVTAKANRRKAHVTFSFDSKDCSLITAFSDRPVRQTRQMKMNRFAKNFKVMFDDDDDKPNASLTHWDEDGFHNHMYEIMSIKKKNGKFYIHTDLLENTYLSSALNDLPMCQGIGCVKPPIIPQANFFVDPAIGTMSSTGWMGPDIASVPQPTGPIPIPIPEIPVLDLL